MRLYNCRPQWPLSVVISLLLASFCLEKAVASIETRNHFRHDLMDVTKRTSKDLSTLAKAPESASFSIVNEVHIDMMGSIRDFERKPTFGLNYVGSKEIVLLQQNGIAQAELEFWFRPDRKTNLSDYIVEELSSDLDVLIPGIRGDTEISDIVLDTSTGDDIYNFTVLLTFDGFVGDTNYTLRYKGPGEPERFGSYEETISFTVGGASFYREIQQENGTTSRELVSGENQQVRIDDYRELEKGVINDVSLGIAIQYLNGSYVDVNNANDLIDFTQWQVNTRNDKGQVFFGSQCDLQGGRVRNGLVVLRDGCGYGLPANGEPYFGVHLEPYRSGQFQFQFMWDAFTAQSLDFAEESFQQVVNFDVGGNAPPMVIQITPSGPFSRQGEENITVHLINAENLLNGWITVEGVGTPFLVYPGSFVDHGAAGSAGYIQEQVGDVSLSGVDVISISSETGSLSGFERVSLVAKFPNGYDPAEDILMFGDVSIPSSDLTVVSETGGLVTFAFNVPAYPSGSYRREVHFVSRGETSSRALYFYQGGQDIQLFSISPSSGPVEGGTPVSLTGYFPNGFDKETDSLMFGGDALRPDEIVYMATDAIGITTIGFLVPVYTSGNLQKEILVQVGEAASNAAYFSYQGGDTAPNPYLVPGAPFTQEVVLITEPGSGQDLDWDMTISTAASGSQTARDLSNPAFLFSYFPSDIAISSISPDNGPPEGGYNVTLTGSFAFFDPDRDAVFVNNQKIDSSRISSTAVTSDGIASITFTMPAYSGGSYTQNVQVLVGTDLTVPVPFTYQVLNFRPTIEVVGGTQTGDGTYSVGACSSTEYSVDVDPPAALSQGVSFSWTAYETFGAIVAKGQGSSLVVDPELLQANRQYTIRVVVTTKYSSATGFVKVVKLGSPAIGVTVLEPSTRSISTPNAPQLISSVVTLPTACYEGNLSLIYTWTYRNKAYEFSSGNVSEALSDVTTPTRLGREFNIAQSDMAYGVFEIRLTAQFVDDPDVSGMDSALFEVVPSELVPVINSGESQRLIGPSEDLLMTATNSFDPDVLDSAGRSADLVYTWTCLMSKGDKKFTSQSVVASCTRDFLPSSTTSSFSVSQASLLQVLGPSTIYLRYTLIVSKTSQRSNGTPIERTSETAEQILELSSDRAPLTSVSGFSVTSPNPTQSSRNSSEIDLNNVKFFSDIVIAPQTGDTEIAWRVRLTEPVEELELLQRPNTLLGNGYISLANIGSTSALPLGIKSNRLSPNKRYVFEFQFSKPSEQIGLQYLELRTVEKPALIFPDLDIGVDITFDTEIRAYADTTFESSDLLFYFFLENKALNTSHCVGGCSGYPTVYFRIGIAGNYALKCVLVDGQGISQLDEKINGVEINVRRTFAGNVSAVETELNVQQITGDHAAYEQLSRELAVSLGILGTARSARQANTESLVVSESISVVSQIVGNSIPNTLLGNGYLRTALTLASLGPEDGVYFTEADLYNIAAIPRNVLLQTPESEELDIVTLLGAFYNVTIYHATQLTSRGSTRRRLLQEEGIPVNQILLDLFEQMKTQFLVGSLKHKACGFSASMTTGDNDNIKTNIQGIQDMWPTRIETGVYCNQDQGSFISVDASGAGFEWCPEAFGQVGLGWAENSYFFLMASPDYIADSGVQGSNSTDTAVLLTSMIGQLGQKNSFTDTAPDIEYCYVMKTSVRNDFEPQNDSILDAYTLTNAKEWGVDAEQYTSYSRDFERIITGYSPSSSQVRMYTNRVGTFGAKEAVAPPTPDPVPPTLEPQRALTGSAIAGVITGLLLFILLAVLVAWLIATRCFIIAAAPPPVQSDFTYVERDVYGRGAVLNDDDPLDEDYSDSGDLEGNVLPDTASGEDPSRADVGSGIPDDAEDADQLENTSNSENSSE